MRIPEVQSRLRALADAHNMPELEALASELSRRPARKRAANSSARMTPEMRDAIRAYRRAQPDAAQTAIARVFNVNPGRVSEALRGFRD